MGPKLLLFLALLLPLHGQAGWLRAPVPDSPPVNQLRISGNACGPACLLDAFRSGGKKWRKSVAQFEGEKDVDKMIAIIRAHGKKGSRLDPKKARWNKWQGVNATDLVEMANEMKTQMWMGNVGQKLFFSSKREQSTDLLERTHRDLVHSMKKGFPPILSIRRMAWRAPSRGAAPAWLTVKRHFVVLTGLPDRLPKNAHSFLVTYHDPWGGKSCQGVIEIPNARSATMGTLLAKFPQSKVGNDLVKSGEAAVLSLSSAVGLF